jgi:hypothetical protein
MCTETCPFATALFPNFGHSVLSCIKKVRKTNYTMVNYTEMSVLSSEMEHPGAIFALVGGSQNGPARTALRPLGYTNPFPAMESNSQG